MMTMNKALINLAVISVLPVSISTAYAALPVKAQLNFDAGVTTCIALCSTPGSEIFVVNTGSYFGMDTNGNATIASSERTAIAQNNGLLLSTAQAASGSHGGPINGSETPGIDAAWEFFGNTGLHYSITPADLLSAAGNTATVDLSGWTVTWNGIPAINMGGGSQDCGTTSDGICVKADLTDVAGVFDNGTSIATITCAVDCAVGDTYTLDYNSVVPQADPSNFGGVKYTLHLVGTIAADANQAPIATTNPLSSSVTPSGSIRVDAVGNTTDPDGDGIDATSVQVAYTGSRSTLPTLDVCTAASTPHAMCLGAGDVIYTDNLGTDTITSDTFTYTVTDTLGAIIATPVTVNMDVVTGNLPPVCGNNTPVTTNVNTAIDIDVASNATDSDGTIAVATVATSNPVNGTPGTPTALGFVNFLPDFGVVGTATFDYTVQDDAAAVCSSSGTITININDLPVAVTDNATVDRNSSSGVVIDVTANDTDSDGTVNKTTVLIASPAANGGTSVDPATGKVTYTPNASYLGADTFTYTVKDNAGATSIEGTVNIIVVNALPVAVDDVGSIDTALVSSVDINVVANDTDADGGIAVTTVIASQGSNGSTSVNASGVVTYTPNGGYTGSDTFTYTVNDVDSGISNVATVVVSVSNSSTAVLDTAAFLSIVPATIDNINIRPADGTGSWFSMETQPGSFTHTPIQGFNQLQLGTSQPASAASPDIDSVWSFFGNPGVHQTTSAVTVLTDDGNGHVTLDLSGWNVSWNSIPSIPMNSNATVAGFVDGVAIVTCAVDCAEGDSYTLEYSATVPVGDASGFGGVHYFLHLEGTISLGATTIGGGNLLAPYDVTETAAIDNVGAPVAILPGATAVSVGNVTGIYLSPVDIGLKDPKLNEADGAQCVGGCLDFEATGVTGDYMDLVVYLSEVIPEGANYRKLMNGIWQDFDESQGDLVGSAPAVAAACQATDGEFQIGLRAGNQCLFLRIYDGGPNDADGLVNGTIVDPSGVLVAGSPNVPASSADGCSVSSVPVKLTERADWLLVAAFIAGFGLLTYRRRERNIR